MSQEIGECDCCNNQEIKITICPQNNKCEYKLCDSCISSIKDTTKSDKCPACREVIFQISSDSDSENSENSENENSERNISIFTFISNTQRSMIRCIKDYISCICFVIYEISICPFFFIKEYSGCWNEVIESIFLTRRITNKKIYYLVNYSLISIVHVLIVLILRLIFLIFAGEHLMTEYWCSIEVFLLKAFFGLGISLCILCLFCGLCQCCFDIKG